MEVPTVSIESYVYEPLNTQDLEIRLIQLLPENNPTDVSDYLVNCVIHHVSLKTDPMSPQYEALSYNWGDATIKWPIIVSGHVFLVTRNLEEALRSFRHTGKTRLLWVDAICIDQASEFERTQQVQLMRQIYQSSKEVLVWLGVGHEDTVAAFRKARIEYEKMTELKRTQSGQQGDLSSEAQGRSPLTFQLTSKEVCAISKIFLHPWWERVWIIQEATVARQLTVFCGIESIPWSLLNSVHRDVEAEASVGGPTYDRSLFHLHRINLSRSKWRWPGAVQKLNSNQREFNNLIETLAEFRDSKAKDRRDKVYALLGLSRDTQIIPDYTIETNEAFTELAITALVRNSYTKLLYHCLPPEDGSSLPSWVPDVCIVDSNQWIKLSFKIIAECFLLLCSSFQTIVLTSLKWGVNPEFPMATIWFYGMRLPAATEFFDSAHAAGYSEFHCTVPSKGETRALSVRGFLISTINRVVIDVPIDEKFRHSILASYCERALPVFTKEESHTTGRTSELPPLKNQPVTSSFTGHLGHQFLNRLKVLWSSELPDQSLKVELLGMGPLLDHLFNSVSRRCLLGTDRFRRGEWGVGRADVIVGDHVVVVLGVREPCVLRRVGEHFVFVGTCYWEGAMLGERMREVDNGTAEILDFVLH